MNHSPYLRLVFDALLYPDDFFSKVMGLILILSLQIDVDANTEPR